MGFWPGGDRDGNPFVTSEITMAVAQRLKHSIVRKYLDDVKWLKKRLTFRDVEPKVEKLTMMLEAILNDANSDFFALQEIRDLLKNIKATLIEEHQSLFLDDVQNLINKVYLFGLHFASLDIRQDSRVIERVFQDIVKANGIDIEKNGLIPYYCRIYY
ncbi:MAG: phosphoenolpyruvate carboxylase [Saprospiraceae bacterium]